MNKKEREERNAKVIEMYKKGGSYKDIKKEVMISRRTFHNIIKGLPPTTKEAHKAKKLSSNYAQFRLNCNKETLKNQDEIEGWITDTRKIREEERTSARHFMYIMYPENLDKHYTYEKMTQRLESSGVKAAISPLHNKDPWLHDSPEEIDEETGEVIYEEGERYKQGDKKKAHYHILVDFGHKITYEKAIAYGRSRFRNQILPREVYSVIGAYEYLWHKNEDASKKHIYQKNEVEIINGFTPELTTSDKKRILVDIVRRIEEENIQNIDALHQAYDYSVEIITTISSNAYYLTKVMDRQWKKAHPEGSVRKVEIVQKEENYDE